MEKLSQTDFILRMIAVCLLGSQMIYWRVTEIKADREKPRAHPQKSPKRLITSLLTILILLQIAGLSLLPFEKNFVLQLVGLVFVVIGVAVSMEGRRVLGTNWSHAAEYQVKKDQELITASVYRFIRNPIYAGLFLSVSGVELIVCSYFVLLLPAIIAPLMHYQAVLEEKILSKHFGEKYQTYKTRTKRFIPYLW